MFENNIITKLDVIIDLILSFFLFDLYSGISLERAAGNPKVIIEITKKPKLTDVIAIPYSSWVKNFPANSQKRNPPKVVVNQDNAIKNMFSTALFWTFMGSHDYYILNNN